MKVFDKVFSVRRYVAHGRRLGVSPHYLMLNVNSWGKELDGLTFSEIDEIGYSSNSIMKNWSCRRFFWKKGEY